MIKNGIIREITNEILYSIKRNGFNMSNKKICAFFGHGDCPSTISDSLEKEIISAVKNNAITTFWYGGYGQFDALAAKTVTRVAKNYFPEIELVLVHAYLPTSPKASAYTSDISIYPDGLETVPPRFAISHRNRWMARHCDYMIAYINHRFGGAYQAVHAAPKEIPIRNLGSLQDFS